MERRYIEKEKKQLVPTELGEVVNKLLTENFTNTQAKLREHNFVWSEQALPDYQLGVVSTPIYEYYIYNGKEWKSVIY